MPKEQSEKTKTNDQNKWSMNSSNSGLSALYGLGFVGAVVYWLQAASSFQDGLFGILKAIVWPAIVIYKLLESFYGIV